MLVVVAVDEVDETLKEEVCTVVIPEVEVVVESPEEVEVEEAALVVDEMFIIVAVEDENSFVDVVVEFIIVVEVDVVVAFTQRIPLP
jgi:hypothetical protein